MTRNCRFDIIVFESVGNRRCMMNNILIIDDDMHINNMLDETLTREGYKVSHAYSGTEALLVLKNYKPDIVLLDLMLPGLSGERILPQIKDIPVIVISAKMDVANKVDLLLGGAVDYVTKPFQTKELLARIAVHLRIRNQQNSGNKIIFDDIEMDMDHYGVKVSGNDVKLTKTEYAILKMLMQNKSIVLSKTQILDCISMDTPDCTESSLKTHISNLRKKLREVGNKEYIESVWGIGFKLIEP